MENVTSCARRMSQMSSQRSYMMFSRLWVSIHFASSDPPRDTIPISRLFTCFRCARRTPAWIVK